MREIRSIRANSPEFEICDWLIVASTGIPQSGSGEICLSWILLALAHFPSWICRHEFVIRHKDYQHGSTSSDVSSSSTPSVGRPVPMSASPHLLKKLSVPLSRVNYYLLSLHPKYPGAVPLLLYRKYTRLLGEFLFFGLVELSSPEYITLRLSEIYHSSAQWIYLLRLWIHLPWLIGFIFLRLSEFIFGSMDLYSSAYWICLIRFFL